MSRDMSLRLRDVTDDDLACIAQWLHADHVRSTWGDPDANVRLFDKPPATGRWQAIIEADGHAVGVVLWQHPTREELDLAGLTDIPTSVVDIDIMLGEVAALGRGWVGRNTRRRRGRVVRPNRAVRDGVRSAGQSGVAAGFRQGWLPQGPEV